MKERTIAESWKPTFENVAREFITETMYRIYFSDILPNFRFEFMEDEAIRFIEKILEQEVQKYSFWQEKANLIIQKVKYKSNKNEIEPVMIVKNYKKFFELLRQYYEEHIELYFQRTKNSGFPRYEKDNCFEQIWLRATPDDFNNPESFLEKQVAMLKDKTFEKYNKETYLGKFKVLNDNIICVENGIARTWDENSREFKIKIYDKNFYNNTELFERPNYMLPVIRYGIYERDGKKVCLIGSIQNKNDEYKQNELKKMINRKKYQINKDIPQDYKIQVEPKNLLALSIFIDFLNSEGITEIEVPGMYVLDYEYHGKRNEPLLEEFKKEWTKEKIKNFPKMYEESLYYFERMFNKQDLISEIKTERLLLTFRRLLYHYQNGYIESYPSELDSFLHLNIPAIKDENEINGDILKELFKLVKDKYSEKER